MATLQDVLLVSALESLDIEDYWPAFNSKEELDDEENDGEYPIILYFYENLLDDMLRRSLVSKSGVQRAIAELVYNYGRVSGGRTPREIDYDDLDNCFGYLHRYAACHTALVRNALLKIFHANPPPLIKRMLSLREKLHVVSLGGGPGNDFVGFCSAIYGKHYGLTEITVTVVDIKAGWERVFMTTDRMIREKKCGNASSLFSEVNVKTFFIQGDLRERDSWNTDLKNKLQSADMVLLVKVLSVVPDTEKLPILQNVVMSMKPGSLLIYIDCPFPESQFYAMDPWLEPVYKADKKKFQYNYEVNRFNYPNITSSHALVRLFVRKFHAHD